jgi:hypothetical protein
VSTLEQPGTAQQVASWHCGRVCRYIGNHTHASAQMMMRRRMAVCMQIAVHYWALLEFSL